MSSRNQSSCSQLWFCRSRSWGGRHGQADQRVAAADLHGRVHRERHILRNPAPLSRRANLVRAGAGTRTPDAPGSESDGTGTTSPPFSWYGVTNGGASDDVQQGERVSASSERVFGGRTHLSG